MFSAVDMRFNRVLFILVLFHVTVIAASNYLVQIPFQFSGIHTTWGTFSFPFIFLATDLTVRVFGQVPARKIIFLAMIPALLVSYLVSILFFQGSFQGFGGLTQFNGFVFRIAFASFIAYLAGQLLDITVFSYLRKNRKWWVAPSVSTVLGNMLDTVIFYSVAFWRSSDDFMALHWPEIALVDYFFKIVVSLLFFLPAYGLLLATLTEAMMNGSTSDKSKDGKG
jgi:uncharacterized integral membrane protein (TIGR00697 family)